MFNFVSRNSESSTIGMKGNSNGVRGLASPERGEKRGPSTSNNNANNSTHHHNNTKANNSHHNNDGHQGGSWPPEAAHHEIKTGGAAVWPKFVIALTNKEKEEDFMAIKGSKLPQRPKKRAKLIQRTLNVSIFSSFFF